MPLYEYECQQCGKRTELLQRFGDAPLAACPACGGEVKKLFYAPAVQFKGSGWYVTDYANKGAGASKSEGKPEGKADRSEGGSDKPEGKAEPKEKGGSAKKESAASAPSSPAKSGAGGD